MGNAEEINDGYAGLEVMSDDDERGIVLVVDLVMIECSDRRKRTRGITRASA